MVAAIKLLVLQRAVLSHSRVEVCLGFGSEESDFFHLLPLCDVNLSLLTGCMMGKVQNGSVNRELCYLQSHSRYVQVIFHPQIKKKKKEKKRNYILHEQNEACYEGSLRFCLVILVSGQLNNLLHPNSHYRNAVNYLINLILITGNVEKNIMLITL